MVFDVNSIEEKYRVRDLQFIVYSPLLYQQNTKDELRRIYQTLYYFLTAKRQVLYLHKHDFLQCADFRRTHCFVCRSDSFLAL